MSSRMYELLEEHTKQIGVPSATIMSFIRFLVDKIEKLENPVINVQIPIEKTSIEKGDKKDVNSKEE